MPGKEVNLTHYFNSEWNNCCENAAVRVTYETSPNVLECAVIQKPFKVWKKTVI